MTVLVVYIPTPEGEAAFSAGLDEANRRGEGFAVPNSPRGGAVRAEKYVHAFAALWLSRMTDREKDVEILALRHQLAVLHRQLGGQRPRLRPEDRALLAAMPVRA